MSSESEIDTVVLDLGQVLVDWEPQRAHPHLSAQAWHAVAAEIDFHALNLRADAGETWASLEEEVAAAWPQHAGFLARYAEAFATTLTGPVPGMPELVGEMRARGLRLLGLTNWSSETFPHGRVAVPAMHELEAIVVSGDLGLVKPDPAIYQHLLDRFDVAPARALFVDDRLANVEAARALGLHGHVFTDAASLRRELAGLGVVIDPPA
ncbi:HAD family hydrolase [Serinibacter arcticus]|uniref:HAD family hydrolase n=1 Tax=Serinibacter arcticus TaxID=1655435 RepID=UPI0026B95A70